MEPAYFSFCSSLHHIRYAKWTSARFMSWTLIGLLFEDCPLFLPIFSHNLSDVFLLFLLASSNSDDQVFIFYVSCIASSVHIVPMPLTSYSYRHCNLSIAI